MARALWWEVDSEIERACEEVREPFKLRRDVARLELDGMELEGMERGAQPVGVSGFDSASPLMPSINSVLPSRSRSP